MSRRPAKQERRARSRRAIAEPRRGHRAVGQHSSASAEWGSPEQIIELARQVLGEIDLDPASSEHWNELVRALRIITKKQNALITPWVEGAPAPHKLAAKRRLARPKRCRVYLNPPGDAAGELVAAFWRALAGYFELGWITSAIYVGFSVEQLARLQRIDAASHPLEHVTLIPCRRLRYRGRGRRAKKQQPGHASFITLLSTSRAEIERFRALGARLGCVVRGDRWR